MKMKKLLASLAVLAVFLIIRCSKDEFVEFKGLCPVVIATNPVNTATDVPLNQVISVTFNEKMNPLTINNASFKIIGAGPIDGTITYSGNTAYFTPTILLIANTTYTGKVTTAVKDSTGNALQKDYEWTFTTGTTIAPIVISTDPVNHETNVILDKVISATFNIPMDPQSISGSSFLLNEGSNSISGTISYSGTTAFFTPDQSLRSNTVYTATITTGAKDLAGTSLAGNYVWTFTTLGAIAPTVLFTDPANNETGVLLSKTVTATFSEAMNASTINSNSFIIRQGALAIAGTVSYSGTTASFKPVTALTPNTTYTATIKATVKNVAGTYMVADYIWVFSTGVTLAPTVISTDPSDNAINVPLNKTVTATFSVTMNPLTITTSSFILKQGATIIPGTVSYSGITASFNPTVALSPNTIYTGIITTGVKNSSGVAMSNDYVWTFTTESLIVPAVISTDPVNNATNVPVNKVVTATFSMPMNPFTITTSSFILKQGNSIVQGTVTYSGTKASFTPSVALTTNTIYTATITTGAKNLAGTPIANDYVWTFTTESIISPTVIATDPANNATNVPLGKIITATFSVPMDPLTINASTFTLKNGSTLVAGTISYLGTTATFTPTNALSSNTVYTATITTGAKNLAGTSLASNYVWSFTTLTVVPPSVISTDPANNATGVALNKIITATFNMAMDPLTINSGTFILKQGSTVISGTITYAGTTATFAPTNALTSNTVYTATITTGAKNLAGTSLASNYVWSFTTLTVVPPSVISTDPANNATGVALNKVITASFNMQMDPATLNTTTFLLKQGNTLVSGSVSYSGTTASFTPVNSLNPNTVYTATITTGAKNLAGIPLANDYVWSFTTKASLSAPFVNLNSVARFGIIAGVGVSNNAGFSEIHDLDVGIYPGVRSSVTGFPPAIVVNGAIYAADDLTPPGTPEMLLQAKNDLTAAYNFAKGATTPAPNAVSGDIGGLTLVPGIYKTTSTLLIQSGNLTLDAQGDPNAVWIFQIGTGFTTVGGAGGSVILSGGAQAANVFWQTGSSATIGDGTSFVGNILALTSITMNSTATAEGRMLAINGAVVMTNTNFIYKP